MARPDTRLVPALERGRLKARAGQAPADALFRFAPFGRTHPHPLVFAQRGELSGNGKPFKASAEHLLPRLPHQRMRRHGGRHRSGRAAPRSGFHARTAKKQVYNTFVRQADDGRHHPSVDGNFYAAQFEVARNLLSGGVPRSEPVGDYRRQRAQAHCQAGMLCVRLRARQGAEADFGLLLPPQRRGEQPRKEGCRVYSLPACARLRRKHDEAN